MAFLRRLLFYAIGIGLGILIVLAFFGERDFDYAYGPQARVKKNFRTKPVDSTTLATPLLDLSQDSIYYQAVVNGRVDFGSSNPRKEPYGEFLVRFSHASYAYEMLLENSDTVRVLSLEKDID
jgi:hypothetical protein